MDNIMPNLTGPTATKVIRTIGYNNLIFGITGNGSSDDINDFLSEGCDYVFIKPFTKDKLQMIYDFISINGYKRKENYKLFINNKKLNWIADDLRSISGLESLINKDNIDLRTISGLESLINKY